jgi:3-isopropylmalate dehydrogenase
MRIKITALPGDGIGPEVTSEAARVLDAIAHRFGHQVDIVYKKVGGRAIKEDNDPLPDETLQSCLQSDAVFLGAVGAPEFDTYPTHQRPEAGLLRLRRELGAFANIRPAKLFAGLAHSSPLRPDIIDGTDVIIVRELLGGLYFGEPRGIREAASSREAINTMRYSESEVERIARIAFELARSRRRRVTSVDKANVLESSRLWREVVIRVASDYPDVSLEHQYVDSCAMALVSRPRSFDVMVTENLFGDILSDEAGAVVGSLGLLASASIGGRVGLFEPVHGSAPDIAGRGIANPCGAILSMALMLRYAFKLEPEAAAIESAVESALATGLRTCDLAATGDDSVTTEKMGRHIAEQIGQMGG